ncbi:MAG: hypothetical protein MAG795_00232 [Candidatus Woesearchaeota archaeon]|nr:hypothetical protein [Candidatus Woesearchaeota archaeon]
MKITNEQIYKKLEEITQVLDKLKQEEEELIHKEEEIEMEEEKLLKLLGKKVNRKHESVLEWTKEIWQNCLHKKSHMTEKKIDFLCKKTGNTCRFVDCPLNREEI